MQNIPHIDTQEFTRRRTKLMQTIGDDAIVILPSSQIKIRNRDAEFPFRQDSDFLYLTGFNEPQAVLVLVPGREGGETILFCRDKDPKTEQWTGRMIGLEGAVSDYGADDAFPIEDIDEILPGLMENRASVYYSVGVDLEFDSQVISWANSLRAKVRQGVQAPHEFISLDVNLHEMRLFKSEAEQNAMRFAAKTAMAAHKKAMQACCPGKMEYELEAQYLYEFRKNNMTPAYSTIVGGGENGCILHYVDNDAVLKDGDLVLIDAGAEYLGYASDITRTFPVNGQFSEAQAQLYQIVLDAQYAAIEKVKPGNSWIDPHDAAVRVITAGLLELGLLEGELETLIKEEKLKPFYMHKTGHWLGLDVHDVGEYKVDGQWRELQPGMVLTVEPGLYISPDKSVDEKWWNIGIRIEDDVLVTDTGHQVLTGDLIKEISEIESWMAETSNVS
jgi:Xaa-Pro aminopeptidase